MKTNGLFVLLLLAAAAFFLYLKYSSEKAVTQEEFRDYRQEFKAEIDTLNLKIDTANMNIDTLKIDVDTLKRGQHIIYKEVRKNADKKFWDLF
jgi:hypothetical protein